MKTLLLLAVSAAACFSQTLYIAGDSTANNTERKGWGDHVAEHLPVPVINRARAGRSARTFLTEGLWDGIVNDLKPNDYVLIQFGHNDGGPPDKDRARGDLPGIGDETKEFTMPTGKVEVVHTFGWYLRRFVNDTKAKGAHPIVLSLTVRNIWTDGKVERGSGQFGQWSRDVAKAENVPFVDVTTTLADAYEKMGEAAVKPLFPIDHTHTSVEGARLVASLIAPGVRPFLAVAAASPDASFDVRSFGAKGDGKTQDRGAINRAIEAASARGGGTVDIPPGVYLSGSIRLRSNITLNIQSGAVIEASEDGAAYDAPEPNASDKFQDFGHSHWHNSLIWGENLENVTIMGGGLISGKALTRERGAVGDKAIALKLSHNITLRDFKISQGGHFGILATGVDNLTIDNLTIDTNRDGMDIDSCRNVRISNCSVNAPNDDAIVLKGSHALGMARSTENMTIANCLVSGYDIGSLLDATYKRTVVRAPDRDGPTGRIKIGTESEGDFRNITISNIVFDRSRGLAFESVDGSHIEDIAVSNITMKEISNAPFFFRIGSRMRAPEGVAIGSIRRISIDNVVVSDADPRYGSIIAGLPGHEVEDIRLSNIRIVYRGGHTLDQVAKQPADLVNTFFYRAQGGIPPREPYDTPEREKEYPEPSMFGMLPAYGFYMRHAKGIELTNVQVGFMKEDTRPAFVLDDVHGADFINVKAQKAQGVPSFVLRNSTEIRGAQTDR